MVSRRPGIRWRGRVRRVVGQRSARTRCGPAGIGGGSSGDAGVDTGTDAPVATCSAKGAKHSVITANHGHALLIPAADFVAPANGTHDIQGGSGHAHSVTLTAAQLTLLKAGTSVTVTSSSGNGHMHDVTIVCA